MSWSERTSSIAILAALTLISGAHVAGADDENSVVVLHEGYVRPIEGKTFVPGQSDDGAREVAIEFGRNIKKHDPTFVVYEYRKPDHVYVPALTINPRPR